MNTKANAYQLGPNGAGKSTLCSLIRGDIQPSKNEGSILVDGISVSKHRAQARSHLGVCPQFDAIDQLSVLETLRFYARVRGVSDIEYNVNAVLQAVGLQNFSQRMAAALSGGNKRKLSLAIALTGDPTVLLLDEPSSGMDAAAKVRKSPIYILLHSKLSVVEHGLGVKCLSEYKLQDFTAA